MAPTFALAANPMAGLWRAYNRLQRRRPLACSMATSAALWATGDVVSQHVQHACRRPRQRGSSCDGSDCEGGPGRVVATGAFGGLVFGPLGHLWYTCLDKLVAGLGAPGTLTFLLAKVLADNIIFTPLYVGLFMAYNSLLVSRSGTAGTLKKLQQDFLPTVAAEGVIWPPIMAVLFATVPLSHQVRGLCLFQLCLLVSKTLASKENLKSTIS